MSPLSPCGVFGPPGMVWRFGTGGVRGSGDGRAAEGAAAMTDSVIYRGRAFEDLMVGGGSPIR